MTTRRTFLKTSSFAAVAAVGHRTLPRLRARHLRPLAGPLGELPQATDPQLKELAMRALDAAKTAGASYADVRFTVTRYRYFRGSALPTESEALAVGVRALAKGTWGFAAHSDWTPDLVAQLGRKAAEQAQVDTWSGVPPIELVEPAPAAVGNWVMPVKRDPFTVPVDETAHLIQSIAEKLNPAAKQLEQNGWQMQLGLCLSFERQERTFASTAGAFTTQTVYTSLGGVPHQDIPPSQITLSVRSKDDPKLHGLYAAPFVTPVGAGYEVVEEANILDHLLEWLEMARMLAQAKQFEQLGQYDVVLDGAAMAALVDGTFGAALEYDRAVGYEADAGGTSYLAPPLKILGTSLAPAAVTVTGDRTLPRGAATVGWDDEGIAPAPFPLVKDGVVVDYASSREFVKELAPWYQRQRVPARSNGCAASETASTVPLVYTPNLVLQPAAQDTSLEALLARIDDGLLICGGDVQMDMQQSSGRGKGGQVYRIKQGKQAELVKEAVYTFRSTDVWKNLAALGGPSTAAQRGLATSKGQPNQLAVHSVNAVAAHFRKVQVANATHV